MGEAIRSRVQRYPKWLAGLNADKVPLHEFSPEAAIDLWWKAENRKPTHGLQKQYKKRTPRGQASETPNSGTDSSEEEEEEDEEDKLLLDDWDDWMQKDSDWLHRFTRYIFL